ncbi:hypothetical protein EJ08DRAFT_260534 [Tothia fuscella]|uniref:Uncharacterized protein n=1 Tax=Tothia fuscella TaxID=1048955 RepID=A0A9P4NQV7_9PEZI|nr:hypothetical protein EJ08DRAFT_260534 [Tothia fuscella]
MPFFRPVRLPIPIIAASVTAVGLGLYTTIFRRPIYSHPHTDYTPLVPSHPTGRVADTISLLGVVMTGLEVTYLVSSYMPLEENQFIAASVPIRLGLSALMASVCWIHRQSMSDSGFWELLALSALDASAAIQLGFRLGRWDGMIHDAERWF